MRHRSRSRNYDSNDNYKTRRSPVKYESSRSHKSKGVHSHYSSDSRRHDSGKIKKSSDRSRYESHRDRDSESEDKYDKKASSSYDHDYKKSRYSKYVRNDSPSNKHLRKFDDYTHSYKRRSLSSDISNRSYDSKYKKVDEKSDVKGSHYKSSKDYKRNKQSHSQSSDELSDSKVKTEAKDKLKDKKLKKKAKKSDKDKEKKKRKRQRQTSEEDISTSDGKRHAEEKSSAKVSKSVNEFEDQDAMKDKLKMEPFKVKESSNLKSQINFLNSSNIFTKDEWQKEPSDDDLCKKEVKKIKTESVDTDISKEPKVDNNEIIKETSLTKSEEKDTDKERSKRKRNRVVQSKTIENNLKNVKSTDYEDEKNYAKSSSDSVSQKERSYSHNKSVDSSKITAVKEKGKSKDHKSSQKNNEDRKKIEDSFEDERIELPRTPTDAQYIGLFARLQEEPVSDTEIEAILPPILLDDRMKALLINDPNATQESWDSEDDVILNRRENAIAPKHRGVLETLDVPWKLLIEEASLNRNKKEKNNGLSKFDLSNILENIGISKNLAGDVLWADIQNIFYPKFLHPTPPVHQCLMSKRIRRNSIFSERGLFAGALTARKDLLIRKVLYEPIF